MVVTRSADKRIVSNNEEDLVLRSRTVASPLSVNLTPSKLGKRVKISDQTPAPRSKRTKLAVSQESNTDLDDIDNSDENSNDTIEAQDETTIVVTIPSQDESPASKLCQKESNVERTPRQYEIFQTPRTSRHKRFDSVEPEDTIASNQEADSRAHHEYHTADEEIQDSDEAPEVSTAKFRPAHMPQISTRAQKAKARARASDFFTPAKSDRTSPAEDKPSTEATKSTDTIPSKDAVDMQVRQELADAVHEDLGIPAEIEVIETNKRVASKDLLPTKLIGQPAHILVSSVDQSSSEIRAEVLQRTSGAYGNTVGDREDSLPFQISTNIVALPAPLNTSQLVGSVTKFRKPADDMTERGQNSRKAAALRPQKQVVQYTNSLLPDRACSSRSHLIEHKLQRRNFHNQSSWPTKRGSFLTL